MLQQQAASETCRGEILKRPTSSLHHGREAHDMPETNHVRTYCNIAEFMECTPTMVPVQRRDNAHKPQAHWQSRYVSQDYKSEHHTPTVKIPMNAADAAWLKLGMQ